MSLGGLASGARIKPNSGLERDGVNAFRNGRPSLQLVTITPSRPSVENLRSFHAAIPQALPSQVFLGNCAVQPRRSNKLSTGNLASDVPIRLAAWCINRDAAADHP